MKTQGFRNQFKERKKTHGNQTPGRQKAPCQITYMDRFFAKYSRAYKHRGYVAWLDKTRKLNPGRSS